MKSPDQPIQELKDAIARSAASVWSRCYKCDGIVNETGLKCEKPDRACWKWYDAYKGARIAIDKLRPQQDIDKRAALAEAESWAGSEADKAFLAGVFFALRPDKYDPENFAPVEEYFHNLDKHMRQDIYEYLHDLGWSFSHETKNGRRLWARAFYDPYTKNTMCCFHDEEHLIKMAMEAMGA